MMKNRPIRIALLGSLLVSLLTLSVFAAGGVSAADALAKLQVGNSRFVFGKTLKKKAAEDRKGSAKAQHPYAIVLTCSDSRMSPEIVFDESIGRLFVVRNAGNIVDSTTLGSIEYAAEHLQTKLLLVMGHQSCDAVKTAVQGGNFSPAIVSIARRILPAVNTAREKAARDAELLPLAVEENVRLQMQQVSSQSELLRKRIEKKEFRIMGGVYNLETGKVQFIEPKEFSRLRSVTKE